ncbi:LOW QUALITY PROTEIN: tyrosine-protein kinase receptor Tie-1 [Cariama cristata]
MEPQLGPCLSTPARGGGRPRCHEVCTASASPPLLAGGEPVQGSSRRLLESGPSPNNGFRTNSKDMGLRYLLLLLPRLAGKSPLSLCPREQWEAWWTRQLWELSGAIGAGAILDITLIANVQSLSHSDFFLSCIMGERDVSYLQIERENKIVMTHPKTGFQNYRNRSNHVQARGFSMADLVGILYCLGHPTEQAQVVYVHNSHNAHLFPVITQSVNVAEPATFSARVVKRKETDVMWKRNGTYYQTTDRGEVQGDLVTLTLPKVSVSENGVYSATFMGDSPLWSAFYRLIVRGVCGSPGSRDMGDRRPYPALWPDATLHSLRSLPPRRKWGPSCEKDCPDCLNGGICHDHVGECICPPGFMAPAASGACREGQFGRNCQETCQRAQGCRGLSFCLPDPYGCSCASGWSGSRCSQACPPGYYGPDCTWCACRNGGSCNRFSCVCPAGWHGQHCEKSDRFPQIIQLASELEFNLGSEPVVSCVATGNPLPTSDRVELRKADGTVLKLIKAIIEPGQITCEFQVQRLTKADTGLWECLSTTGGQDSRKVKVISEMPPAPLSPPRLLAKQSRQLVVSPVDVFSGDGPIISIKLLYKPKDDSSAWSSIVVDYTENITLMNLRPVTAYIVRVQLSRPGDGGEGSKGPEAVMVTECLEPTVKPVIEGWSIEEKNTLHVNWKLPSNHEPAHGFIVHLFDSARRLVENITSISVLSARIGDLEFNKEYGLEVLVYHCASLGPPSDLYKVMINSKGPSSPRLLSAESVSDTAVRLSWQVPEYPNGGITKYIVELQQVGGTSEPQWIDTDSGTETTKIVGGLNASTSYQFRVRANSHVPGEWSQPVKAKTLGDGALSVPRLGSQSTEQAGIDQQLLLAIVGSVSVTCLTILFALLALFLIKRNFFTRRRTFTYQSGSVSATCPARTVSPAPHPARSRSRSVALHPDAARPHFHAERRPPQFNSGTLTLTRRPKPQPKPLSYPILEWDRHQVEVIGEGIGQVIRAMIKRMANEQQPIKMLKEFASENDHRDFAELEVLCKLGHHPNIINLLGACENKGYLYIAIEYAPYGNLLDFLRKSRLETDPAFAKEHGTASTLIQQLLQFASDVAKGMQYLSEKQFIHRDLAARNILGGRKLASKIADFGLSRGEEVYVKKTMGRLRRWMAIESLNYSVYTTKSDVWSFGVLLWEIVSLGGTPYCGMTCAELYEKLPQGYRMEKPRNCDAEVYELMRQCWRDRPYERPPFAQISMQLIRMLEARKAYVNMALFENFTYAGISATAEEAMRLHWHCAEGQRWPQPAGTNTWVGFISVGFSLLSPRRVIQLPV